MRYLPFEDDEAVAIYEAAGKIRKAIESSTSTQPPAPAPAPEPPPTAPPVAPKSERDLIIAGIEYTPGQAGFPNGWPPIVTPQPKGIQGNGEGTPYLWIATNSKGGPNGGFYTMRAAVEKPMTPDPKVTYNPYDGAGRLAAISAVGTGLAKRQQIFTDLFALVGTATGNLYLENASQADPTWNAALYQLINGAAPEDAWAGVQKGVSGLVSDPLFTRQQLEEAVPVIDGYR